MQIKCGKVYPTEDLLLKSYLIKRMVSCHYNINFSENVYKTVGPVYKTHINSGTS